MNSHRFLLEVLVSDLSSALDAVEADSTAEVAGPADVGVPGLGRIHHDRERIGTKETGQWVISSYLRAINHSYWSYVHQLSYLGGLTFYESMGNSHEMFNN